MLIPFSVRKMFKCVLTDTDSDDEADTDSDETLLNGDAEVKAEAEIDVVALLHTKFMDAKHMAEVEVETELKTDPTQCNHDKVLTFSVIFGPGMIYSVTQYTSE